MKRKWLIVILVLLVVGIVLAVVFINLFRDKDTKELSNNIHTYVEGGYLDEDKDVSKTIVSYLQSIANSSELSEVERNQVQNSVDAYVAFETIAEFFDREIIFAKYTTVYKNNFKSIENDLKKAQNNAKKLVSYLDSHKVESEYWLAGTWADCKVQMGEVVKYTTSALSKLGKVYQASIQSDIMKNRLTEAIFVVIDNQSETLKALFAAENDKVGTSTGTELKNFAESYLSVKGAEKILKFKHNADAKAQVEIILKSKEAGEDYKGLSEYRLLLEGKI